MACTNVIRRIGRFALIGIVVLINLLLQIGSGLAQSQLAHEPLPRTFRGVPQLKSLPDELQNIRLLMTIGEVKAHLNKTGFRYNVNEYSLGTIQYLSVHVIQPQEGFQEFIFYFLDGVLFSMLVEYDMREFTLDFPTYLSSLKIKYGRPAEVTDKMKNITNSEHTYDAYFYRWIDNHTEMEIRYSPPVVKEPLPSSLPAALVWINEDMQLYEEGLKTYYARFKQPVNGMTQEDRVKALKQLLDEIRKRQEDNQNQR